ncbi:hypothetical protein [Haloarchaeobius amylolyticus]|uniref:hypothetical protein n=1 Tax=Haloarchaeobius amylolyticus TaxID=1198296 RepID=UPI00226E98A9|nr:hypothetical protein [Haloarchaeobius amylolyticus]
MNREIGLIAVVLVVSGLVVGASAFTTGAVERSANVQVVPDSSGLIGLEDGTSGNIVSTNTSGALSIDFAQGSATGVNAEAYFEVGNPNDAVNGSAFNITNNDGQSHDITVSYTPVATGDTSENVQFRIYDSTGALVTTVSEENTSQTIQTVASGATHHVVIVVDTKGVSSGTDLSGTLNVSA